MKNNIQLIDELNDKIEGSLSYKFFENQERIKELQSRLDEPTRKYQEYQDRLKIWEEKEKEMTGSEEKQESIKFYKGILKYLDERLNIVALEQKEKRIVTVKLIYAEKKKIVQLYKDLYKHVTEFISKYGNLMNDYAINLDVSIQLDNFHEKFFGYKEYLRIIVLLFK